ncbi:hypothetical protein [Marinimicrobium locisalis]|uniref:hypothetical protein n=1 Tax=Marinimicrobium locisalis TaxID=546022 RepID=UPI0032217198
MSWVFLTEDRVYKLKKPMKRALIDFRHADARHDNCHEEVRLNRRLGGDIYLGVESLRLGAEGRLSLGGTGLAVDWLVVMKRLPESAMLKARIEAGTLEEQALQRAAAVLSGFYRRARVIHLTAEQYRARLYKEVQSNQEALSEYDLPNEQLQRLTERQQATLRSRPALFDCRAEQGMIVEAHGDLRPEHVCLIEPPVVIDCLEFNRDLRIQDRVDELAFLAMECERLVSQRDGSATNSEGVGVRVGDALFDEYTRETGDTPPVALVAFYKSYRAMVRAKLCAWHLDDDPQQQRGRWLEKAQRYLDLAEGYSVQFSG